MKVKTRFLFSFIGFIIVPTLITGGVAIYLLIETFQIFQEANNPALIPVMSHQMLGKALLTLGVLVLMVLLFSIPMGVMLFKKMTQPYVSLFQNFHFAARKRFNSSDETVFEGSELVILQSLSNTLLEDFEKVRDYDKMNSWKNGARMLIHEIKNPMTPLKLSSQSLLLNGSTHGECEDIKQILSSIDDMENILTKFKELVNIDFGPKEKLNLSDFLTENHRNLEAHWSNVSSDIILTGSEYNIYSEKTLLKMLFINLVNNGIEANAKEFYYTVRENNAAIDVTFVTPNTTIQEPHKVFNIGYSNKGSNRGFGLFLCKRISEYLDIDLICKQNKGAVEFSIRLNLECV